MGKKNKKHKNKDKKHRHKRKHSSEDVEFNNDSYTNSKSSSFHLPVHKYDDPKHEYEGCNNSGHVHGL